MKGIAETEQSTLGNRNALINPLISLSIAEMEQPALDSQLEKLTDQIHRLEDAVMKLFAILTNDEPNKEEANMGNFVESIVTCVIVRQIERLRYQNHCLSNLIERLGKNIGKVKIV